MYVTLLEKKVKKKWRKKKDFFFCILKIEFITLTVEVYYVKIKYLLLYK